MTVKLTRTRTISGSGPGPTVGDLKALIDGVADEKTARITYYAGDMREGSSWNLTINEL